MKRLNRISLSAIAVGFLLVLAVVLCPLATPRSARAATIYKNGTITSDETWTSDDVHVINGDLTISSGVAVTIQAGTVVKFEYQGNDRYKRYLLVNGTLDLQGTATDPVVFTSDRDDSYGDDTNGDGNATSPTAGDWGYIKFTNTLVTNVFEYALVRYGGYRDDYPYGIHNYMIWADGVGMTVQYVLVEYSFDVGLYIYHQSDDPAVTVRYTTFRNNGTGVRVLP